MARDAGREQSAGRGDLLFSSVAELSGRLRERDVSPVEVVRAALERIEELNGLLRAFITVLPDRALAAARTAEAEILVGLWRGPLHGIPFAVKDVYFTRGVPTTMASRAYAGFVPDHDAAAVERLDAAGAILLGKTNMVPTAWGPSDYYHPEYGVTRNPWRLDRFSGGSSNGSTTAVTTGMAAFALGGDGGGSIRTPASFCGVCGLKPTFGLVSRYGVFLNVPRAEHFGPLARSAEDCAIALGAIAGHDPRDPSSADRPVPDYRSELGRPLGGLRIGLHRKVFFEDLQPPVGAAVEEAIGCFRRLGAEVEEVDVPGLAEDTLRFPVLAAEAAAAHRSKLLERPEDFVPDVRASLLRGLGIRAVDYLDGLEAFRRLAANLDRVLERVDLLLTPTRDTVAPRMADDGRILDVFPHQQAGRPGFTTPFNLGGQPAISIPCGFDPDGLPIGLQLAGRRFDDATVLRAAHAYQQVTDWHRRHPPVAALRASADGTRLPAG